MPDQIDAPFMPASVDFDPYDIPVAKPPDGAARQRFGAHVPDARARAHPAETRVRDQGHARTEGQMPQRAGELMLVGAAPFGQVAAGIGIDGADSRARFLGFVFAKGSGPPRPVSCGTACRCAM